jgi:hypothetical protein
MEKFMNDSSMSLTNLQTRFRSLTAAQEEQTTLFESRDPA